MKSWLNKYQDGGEIKKSYNSNNAKTDVGFNDWYNKNTIEGKNKIAYNSKGNYDYYSFYKNNEHKNPSYSIESHFPDTYKRPSHETFSNESIYSVKGTEGGSWKGEVFTPSTYNKSNKLKINYADGGIIEDDRGQLDHPGKITKINSNQITMKGVPYPVLGISDTGDEQMMYPEEEYQFDGNSVTEYPMAQNGKVMKKINPKDLKQNITSNQDQTKVVPQRMLSVKQAEILTAQNNAKELERRKQSIQASIEKQKAPLFSKERLKPENLAVETSAIGDKMRMFPNDPDSFIDEYINPFKMIGDMASGLGSVPLNIQEGNYGQAALSVATPLAVGALAGVGTKSTGQFVNNLVNPLAGIKSSTRNPVGKITNDKSATEWLSNWNDSPVNIEKRKDYADLLSSKYRRMGLPKMDRMFDFNDIKDVKLKNYIDLFKEKGVNLKNLYYNLSTSGISFPNLGEVYINNKNFLFNKEGKASTGVHELTHQFENNGLSFNQFEKDDLLEPFGYTSGSYNQDILMNKDKSYYLEPTEIHARINQSRFENNLNPGEEYTKEMFNNSYRKNKFNGMGKYITDRNKAFELFKNFYAAAPIVGGGVTASQMQEEVPQNKNGGWLAKYQDGGVIEKRKTSIIDKYINARKSLTEEQKLQMDKDYKINQDAGKTEYTSDVTGLNYYVEPKKLQTIKFDSPTIFNPLKPTPIISITPVDPIKGSKNKKYNINFNTISNNTFNPLKQTPLQQQTKITPKEINPTPFTNPFQEVRARSYTSEVQEIGNNPVTFNASINPNSFNPLASRKTQPLINKSISKPISKLNKDEDENIDESGKSDRSIVENIKQFFSDTTDNISDGLSMAGNWLERYSAKNNKNLTERTSNIDIQSLNQPSITGDTIPDKNGRYHLPEVYDLNNTTFGTRNRGQNSSIRTQGGVMTTFNPFVDSEEYFKTSEDSKDATYIGINNKGEYKSGNRKDFEKTDYKITKTFSNKVTSINKDADGNFVYQNSNPNASKTTNSPTINVLQPDGSSKTGKMNILIPREADGHKSFDLVTGGRYIFETPDGQKKLVSGSLEDMTKVFKEMKKNNPYVNMITLDNGAYSRGIRKYDGVLTNEDLRKYDVQNTGGGNFAYLLEDKPTVSSQAYNKFEGVALNNLRNLYPGKEVKITFENEGLYNDDGSRDYKTQAGIKAGGNSKTNVSLHNVGAARDYNIYINNKLLNPDKNKEIYKKVLWNAAKSTGLQRLEDWDVRHIGLAKEGEGTAFMELRDKYPELFESGNPSYASTMKYLKQIGDTDMIELINSTTPIPKLKARPMSEWERSKQNNWLSKYE